MAVAPNPAEIFERAAREGERRLDQSMLELTATAFIAGFSIVFGIVALGIIESLIGPELGGLAKLGGAVGLGIGLVFLVVGRAELFSENFFDPAAQVFKRRDAGMMLPLARLWIVTLAVNLVGGALFALVLSVDGVLPHAAGDVLVKVAEEIARQDALTAFLKAFVGGSLVALLSYLLLAVNHVGSQIALALVVGFLLAIGPFSHVVVTALHVYFGILFGAHLGYAELLETLLLATAGNLVGGIGLTTLTHIAQAKGEGE